MKYSIVRVSWVDSVGRSGWGMIDEYLSWTGENDLGAVSVGFLIGETEHSITLVQNITGHAMDNAIKIPRQAIVKIDTLVEADP